MQNKVLLCIIDGYGHGPAYKGNAILNAKTPFLNQLKKNYPSTLLKSSGEEVGIPANTQGGSEVGHLTIGAGRIVPQPLLTIDNSIKDGSFFKMPQLLKAAAHCKKTGTAFHILGMISDQGVHADISHAKALLRFAKQQKLQKVYVHAIADGRDVQPKTVKKFLKQLKGAHIATLIGRYYAMDRDKNLDRTRVAFDLITKGKGTAAKDPNKAVEAAYKAGQESDYYLKPILLNSEGLISPKDTVVFFNFRSDRAAQLTEMLIAKLKTNLIAFGPYTKKAPVLFPPKKITNNLGATLEKHKIKQLRIAETEKYAHVTFFFNSQAKDPFKHEDRILIDSPKCPSYETKPEMSAPKITKNLLPQLKKDYRFIALNFANLDLVGHSGDYNATVKAVETIDKCLQQIIPAALAQGYTILITGDHGNAEHMITKDGSECPSHTKYPVPFHLISIHTNELHKGELQDIAPTILALLAIKKPKEMTGKSLITG